MNDADLPAMPFVESNGYVATGLSKREYFAGLAMNRILAKDDNGVMSPHITAFAAVRMADTLLAELAKEPAQ
jgi:hypothetical protein